MGAKRPVVVSAPVEAALWIYLPASTLRRVNFQCRLDRLVHVLKPNELERVAGPFRNVVIVALVAGREHNPRKPRCSCGDNLFLNATDRENQASYRNLAG